MGLLIDDLAQQVLDQTRVVTNGPVLGPREPLRIDVIPGGGSGDLPVNDVLSLALSATNPLDVLNLKVSYAITRGGTALGSGDVLRVPTNPSNNPADDLLSVAFLLAPRVKLVKSGSLLPSLDLGLPQLDCELAVTLSVTTSTTNPPVTRSKTIKVPFTQAQVEVPLPIPPAICVCCEHAGFTGGNSMVLLPPGGPESVGEVVSQYNAVLDAISSLESLLSLLSLVLKPLQLVVDTLSSLPNPYVATTTKVVFEDYGNDFDDEMTSFVMVAPTGYGIRFSDDWWDDNKTYTTIDLLQLPNSAHGQYILGVLQIPLADMQSLATQFQGLTGQAELGIGVFLVHNLDDSSIALDLRKYDDDDDLINDDIGEALWIMG